MSVTRFFSLALGKYKNFSVVSNGLISAADTTPDVSLYSLLYNTSTNTISYFDNAEEGQIIHVVNIADEKLLFSGAQMKVANSCALWNISDNITFLSHNSSFYELNRGAAGGTRVVQAAVGDNTPTVRGAEVLILNSAGIYQIDNLDDGYEGQQVTILNIGVACSLLNNTSKILIGASGAALVMATSCAYNLVNRSNVWYLTSSTRNAALL